MPTITKISLQKRNKDRYNIFLDGKYSFPVSERVLLDHKLKEEGELSDEKIREIINDENYEKIYQKTLNFLSYRVRSKKEVTDRLREYFYKSGIDKSLTGKFEEKIINSLEKLDLIGDSDFAESYVNTAKELKTPPGRRKMREFMFKKGVSNDIIESVLSDYPVEIEQKGAQILLEKKMRGLKKTYQNKQKMWKYLAGRGYSPGAIEAVVDSNFEV